MAAISEVVELGGRMLGHAPLCLASGLILFLVTGVAARVVSFIETHGARTGL